MRHNGRPPILASSMSPNLISLHVGEHPTAACPDCHAWRMVRRGMLWPHRADDGVSRCPGSGQRIVIDLTTIEWLSRVKVACRDANTRHGSRTQRKPTPPTPPPVHRMAAA
ncbi:hypothetical protein [Nonomuraea dietziae]|uniref:hypothetical protein n=1 Tax=Nonomuraea dietziae TaxID=65515 RepID=UPI0034351D05